jgi:hypothetical protein
MNNKELTEMREQFLSMLNVEENMYPEMEYVADWLDEFTNKLRKAAASAMKEWPEGKKGPGEALILGLARFNCWVLERMQRDDMVADGKNIYDLFTQVLMPTAHEMVIREMEEADRQHEADVEETAEQVMDMAEMLVDPAIPISDIVDKFFKDGMTDEERASVTHKLTEIRRKHIEAKKKED